MLWASGVFTSTCPQPDRDEELPAGCEEPAGEGQPGWEGAPAAGPALEEPCRLVLSTSSSILRDREVQEVRDPPASTGPHPTLRCAATATGHCPAGNRSSVRADG